MTSEKPSAPELIYYCEFDGIEPLEITYLNRYRVTLTIREDRIDLDIVDCISEVPNDFFGSNIGNITAIAGRNGVGKTNIFRNIFGLSYIDNFLIVFKEGQNYIIENNTNYRIESKKENIVIRDKNQTNNQGSILCKAPITLFFSKDFFPNERIKNLHSRHYNRKRLSLKASEMYQALTKGGNLLENKLTVFSNNFNYSFILDGSVLPILNIKEDNSTTQVYEKISRWASESESNENREKFIILLYLLNLFLDENLSQQFDSNREHIYQDNPLFLSMMELLNNSNILDTNLIERMKEALIGKGLTISQAGVSEYQDILKIYENLVNTLDRSSQSRVSKGLVLLISLMDFNKDLYRFLQLIESAPSYNPLFEKLGVVRFSFGEFSAGETELLQSLVSLKSFLSNENYGVKTAVIFIDEYEKHLHPEWLRVYLSALLSLLDDRSESDNDIKIQIVINTHSPYLISDLPKENIRLITKNETTGKREVSIPKHSFASNYYDILSDNFFLDDTIGEFAKQKINSWITELNALEKNIINNKDKVKLKRIDEIKKLIMIVDDQFIRNKLLGLAEDVKNKIIKNADKSLQESLIDDEIAKLEAMKEQLRAEEKND